MYMCVHGWDKAWDLHKISEYLKLRCYLYKLQIFPSIEYGCKDFDEG